MPKSQPARPRRPSASTTPGRGAERRAKPLSPREIDELQALLDAVPAPLDPLDVVMLDGYLCGVLLQPEPVPAARWLRHVTDVDGRALPAGFDVVRLRQLVERRHVELEHAITRRQWFDPWVFELDVGIGGVENDGIEDLEDDDNEGSGAAAGVDAVYPWVAGFAAALELFPALLRLPDNALTEPLALLYRHLDPEDLEEADDLLAEIEALEPPADLGAAVEGLVRATLLLADVSRPIR